MALANPTNNFFHLITGQDFPVKSRAYFLNEFAADKNYLDHSPMPAKFWGANGGMDRIEYYNFYDTFDNRSPVGKNLIKLARWIQRLFRIKRAVPTHLFPRLFCGSTYWSLTRTALQYVVNFTQQNPKAMRRMKYTFCAEEIYFQTILLNSPLAENIVNDNLRYIDWNKRRLELDETDYVKIRAGDSLFARKFHETRSEKLRQLLRDSN